VSSFLRAGDLVTVMDATDPDTNLTCYYNNDNCPCSKILYAIETGNAEGLFAINEHNGAVTVTRDVAGDTGKVYKLDLSVVNRAVEGADGDLVGPKSFAVLKIGVGLQGRDSAERMNNEDDAFQQHARHRRVCSNYRPVDCSKGLRLHSSILLCIGL
jgi:hypothetical protein